MDDINTIIRDNGHISNVQISKLIKDKLEEIKMKFSVFQNDYKNIIYNYYYVPLLLEFAKLIKSNKTNERNMKNIKNVLNYEYLRNLNMADNLSNKYYLYKSLIIYLLILLDSEIIERKISTDNSLINNIKNEIADVYLFTNKYNSIIQPLIQNCLFCGNPNYVKVK
jgi:hypothetical protein